MNKHKIKANKTKKQLCNSYLDLLKTKDINKITIKEITDKAGFNRGTFYIYYRDVYDLHSKLKKEFLENAKTHIKETLETNKNIDFEIMFKTVTNLFIKNEKILNALIIKDNTLSNDIKKIMKPLLVHFFKKDLNNTKIDYIIEYHLSSLFGVLSYWFINDKNISVNELFNILKDITTKGVFNVMMDF